MNEQFIGQIVLNAGIRVPSGWHACDGALLPVMQYTELFSALGNKYGGDGMKTFGLPKLPDAGGAAYVIAMEGSYPA
jgi:microcystin-dependent protein